MIGLKNQFFEKRIINIIQNKNINYALLFHYNSISSKEWVTLKKQVFQINPNIINKVIPNRLLSKLWKSVNLSSMSVTQDSQTIVSLTFDTLSTKGDNGSFGASCLFFCSDVEDLEKILNIVNVCDLDSKIVSKSIFDQHQQNTTDAQLIQNLVKSFSPEGLKGLHTSQKFINIGLLFFSDTMTGQLSLQDDQRSRHTKDSSAVNTSDEIKKSSELASNRQLRCPQRSTTTYGHRNAIYFNFFDIKRLINLSGTNCRAKLNLITNHPNQNIIFQLYRQLWCPSRELIDFLGINSHATQLINIIKITQYFVYDSLLTVLNNSISGKYNT